VLPGMLAMGLGTGLTMAPSTEAITGALPRERQGVANAVAAADTAGPHGQALIRAAQESFVEGWQQAMWAGTVVMVLLFVHILVRGPKGPAPIPASEAEPVDTTAP
jgi:hypothetical protein